MTATIVRTVADVASNPMQGDVVRVGASVYVVREVHEPFSGKVVYTTQVGGCTMRRVDVYEPHPDDDPEDERSTSYSSRLAYVSHSEPAWKALVAQGEVLPAKTSARVVVGVDHGSGDKDAHVVATMEKDGTMTVHDVQLREPEPAEPTFNASAFQARMRRERGDNPNRTVRVTWDRDFMQQFQQQPTALEEAIRERVGKAMRVASSGVDQFNDVLRGVPLSPSPGSPWFGLSPLPPHHGKSIVHELARDIRNEAARYVRHEDMRIPTGDDAYDQKATIDMRGKPLTADDIYDALKRFADPNVKPSRDRG